MQNKENFAPTVRTQLKSGTSSVRKQPNTGLSLAAAREASVVNLLHLKDDVVAPRAKHELDCVCTSCALLSSFLPPDNGIAKSNTDVAISMFNAHSTMSKANSTKTGSKGNRKRIRID